MRCVGPERAGDLVLRAEVERTGAENALTRIPPRHVILRRVERPKHLLQARADLPLAEVAARAGFSDQSQITRHFKRLVGVTPREFRMSARIA